MSTPNPRSKARITSGISAREKAGRCFGDELLVLGIARHRPDAAMKVVIAEVKHSKRQLSSFQRDLRREVARPMTSFSLPGVGCAEILTAYRIAVDSCLVRIRIEDGADRVVGSDLMQIDDRRLNKFLVDVRAVAMFVDIALGSGEHAA